MRSAARQAVEVPGREAPFRRFYLNQWGVGLAPRWLDLAAWDAVRAGRRRRRRPGGGRSSASTCPRRRDLTALACLLPDDAGGLRRARWTSGARRPRSQKRSQQDRVPYALWVEQGYLTATPGDVVDYSYIEARLHELMRDVPGGGDRRRSLERPRAHREVEPGQPAGGRGASRRWRTSRARARRWRR